MPECVYLSSLKSIYIRPMLQRFLITLVALSIVSCASSATAKRTVKPIYHHSYYKKHAYFKHYRVGRIHLKLFEKQGVKTVKKS